MTSSNRTAGVGLDCPVGCFTYVDDAVAGTLLASESSAAIGEAFNIGSMTETTVRDVVALVIKIANVDSVSGAEAIDTAARYGGRYEDIPRRIPDSTKVQRKLGWRLHVDVEEGLPSHHRLGAGQPVVPSERLGLRR